MGVRSRLESARSALIGSAIYLIGGEMAAVLARPSGWGWMALWVGVVAAAGLRFPGVANQVTMVRAYLALPALLLALAPHMLGPLAALVAVAGLSDAADGSIARWLGRPSLLGAALDPVVDGLFFGALALGLALGGAYPLWLGLVVIARYSFPALVGGALLGAGRLSGLRHSFFGQASTALNVLLLGGIAFFRGLGLDWGQLIQIAEVAIPIATLATFANLAWIGWRLGRAS